MAPELLSGYAISISDRVSATTVSSESSRTSLLSDQSEDAPYSGTAETRDVSSARISPRWRSRRGRATGQNRSSWLSRAWRAFGESQHPEHTAEPEDEPIPRLP